MNKADKQQVAKEFTDCLSNTLLRLKGDDTYRPFHSALLSKQALFWSRFERSFSTSFGQGAIQRISKLVALAGGASAAGILKVSTISLKANQLAAIEDHISLIRTTKLGRKPKWKEDLSGIVSKSLKNSKARNVRVISDLWYERKGINNYVSIKTVKPNIDQTAEAKRDLLKLKLGEPEANVFFGLYYNPYGEKRVDYNWTPPMGVFDFHTDPVVLIGRDYWNTLGGSGMYEEVLKIAELVGRKTRKALTKLI